VFLPEVTKIGDVAPGARKIRRQNSKLIMFPRLGHLGHRVIWINFRNPGYVCSGHQIWPGFSSGYGNASNKVI